MPTIPTLYRDGRARLLALAADLTAEQATAPVPACPAWTVKDVYAHLSGAVADVVAGRLDGVATDPWTARHVADRQYDPLDAICAEWSANATAFDSLLDAIGEHMDPRLIIDEWNHEQDVRGAVRVPGARSGDAAEFCIVRMATGLAPLRAEAGRPAVRLAGESGEWLVGEGDPVATLRASDFELVRALVGRRSRRQLASMAEPSAGHAATEIDDVVSDLPVFTPRAADLIE